MIANSLCRYCLKDAQTAFGTNNGCRLPSLYLERTHEASCVPEQPWIACRGNSIVQIFDAYRMHANLAVYPCPFHIVKRPQALREKLGCQLCRLAYGESYVSQTTVT